MISFQTFQTNFILLHVHLQVIYYNCVKSSVSAHLIRRLWAYMDRQTEWWTPADFYIQNDIHRCLWHNLFITLQLKIHPLISEQGRKSFWLVYLKKTFQNPVTVAQYTLRFVCNLGKYIIIVYLNILKGLFHCTWHWLYQRYHAYIYVTLCI